MTRFSSSLREMHAFAIIKNLYQKPRESVRSFSRIFETQLMKLPVYDSKWAQMEFYCRLRPEFSDTYCMGLPETLKEPIELTE